MASGIKPPAPTQPSERDTELVEYEHFIDDQIRKTRAHVRAADVFGALAALAATVVAYLLIVALVDHWVMPHGLGFWSRLALSIGLVGIVAYGLAWHVLPPLVRRINPVYAADTIERHAPGLKNSLVNFLFFRDQQAEVSPAVYEAIEEQAATRLSHVAEKDAVDWSRVIHVLYVLVGLVVIFGLYFAFSPKSPLASASRIIRPWSDIPVPSRVSILGIDPATTAIPRGEQIEVSAEVRGIDPDEPVMLYFSTDNAQTVDRPIAMHVPQGGYRYRCLLPESAEGVQQNLTYRIEAGDAISSIYHVEVTPAPTIVVASVHYEYPKYTGFSSGDIPAKGDIKALEGTRVTIRARANQPIESAYVDFDCDGRTDLAMRSDGIDAQVSFTLSLADDARRPWHASYQLQFTNHDGHANRQPVQYRIEVVRDFPPEIAMVAPEDDDARVSLGGMMAIETVANDPDFALARIELHGEVAGRPAFVEPLLDAQHQGQFVGRFRLRPGKYDLNVGDVVEYWAVARDNKTPEANVAMTPRKRLRIASPEPGEPRPDQLAQDDRQQQPGDAEQKGQRQPQQGEPQQGEQGEGQPGAGQAGGQADDQQQGESGGEGAAGGEGEGAEGDEREPAGGNGSSSKGEGQESGDGEGEGEREAVPSGGEDDGSAFERIQDHFQEQDKQSGGSSSEGGGKPESGSEAEGGGKPESGGAAEGGEPGDQQTDQGETTGAGTEASDDGDPATDESGEGEGQTREGKTEEGKTEEGKTEEGKTEEGKTEEGKTEEGKTEEGKSGAGEKAEGQTGEGDGQGKPPSSEQGGGGPEGGEQPKQETKPGGAGESGDDTGAPEAQREPKPRDKQPGGTSGEPNADEESPASPSGSKHESDSRGEDGGDRSGDGEEGGGQRAPREGTGSAGENQAADEGAGQSDQPGQGETSDQAGNDDEAEGKTGQSDPNKLGKGTGDRPADQGGQGDRPAPQQGEGSGDERQGDEQQGDEQEGDERQGDRPGEGSGEPSGGGKPGNGKPSKERSPVDPGGDEANLEYARKATDLVLRRLEEEMEQDRLDPKLLDKLGWTKDEMARFIGRWRAMQKAAGSPDKQGQKPNQKLDDALRSLGLRPERVERRGGRRADDLGNLRESFRGRPPAEIEEQLRAYNRGVSKAKQE